MRPNVWECKYVIGRCVATQTHDGCLVFANVLRMEQETSLSGLHLESVSKRARARATNEFSVNEFVLLSLFQVFPVLVSFLLFFIFLFLSKTTPSQRTQQKRNIPKCFHLCAQTDCVSCYCRSHFCFSSRFEFECPMFYHNFQDKIIIILHNVQSPSTARTRHIYSIHTRTIIILFYKRSTVGCWTHRQSVALLLFGFIS